MYLRSSKRPFCLNLLNLTCYHIQNTRSEFSTSVLHLPSKLTFTNRHANHQYSQPRFLDIPDHQLKSFNQFLNIIFDTFVVVFLFRQLSQVLMDGTYLQVNTIVHPDYLTDIFKLEGTYQCRLQQAEEWSGTRLAHCPLQQLQRPKLNS